MTQPKSVIFEQQNETILDDPEEDRDILGELERTDIAVNNNQNDIASFASIVRQNQQYNGAFQGKNSILGGGEPYQGRHESILEQIKNPVGYRQSDFQSARFAADPFTIAQNRETTMLKQSMVMNQDGK